MSQQELLAEVVATLTVLGIDYMLTGSVASSIHGEPRASHDIDLVILMPPEMTSALVAVFPPPRYYLSEAAVTAALRLRSTFNLLRTDTGDKVDFWILTDEPFDRSRFARKRVETVLGTAVPVSTPEDTILAKLRWAKLSGGSERQFIDALRVFEVQAGLLDVAYLDRWIEQLDLEDLWQRLRVEARPV
jgi:hypothetical protein